MRYTLKIARTDKGFVSHKFADLAACLASLDMLRSAGKVKRAWIYDRQSALKYSTPGWCFFDDDTVTPWMRSVVVPFPHRWHGMIYSA